MRNVTKIVILLFALAILAAAIAAGCATAPRTEGTTSGIRAAEEVGAAKVPQASLHLQLAKEELALAQGLTDKGEKEQAASMLLRAEADAQLAVTLSHEDAERLDAEKAMARVRLLRQENP